MLLPSCRNIHQTGFTLLEVLVAFSIFALSFGVVMAILSGSIKSTTRSGEMTEAALWAQAKLDMLGVEEPLEEGENSGEFNNKFRWVMTVQPFVGLDTEESSLLFDVDRILLFRVDLVLSWERLGRERRRYFSTVKARVPQ